MALWQVRRRQLRCSFCNKAQQQVDRLIFGKSQRVSICNECIDLANEVLAEEVPEPR